MKDKNEKELFKGAIIDLHQTVNGRNLFVVLGINPLDIRYAYDLLREYEYDKEAMLAPSSFTGETDWEIIDDIYSLMPKMSHNQNRPTMIHSRIGILNPDQSITSIYCHCDGHPAGVGATLKEHYSSTPRALRLQSMGDLYSLTSTIEESTFFDRDRDEDCVEAQTSGGQDAFLLLACYSGAEWAYLWDGQEWKSYSI